MKLRTRGAAQLIDLASRIATFLVPYASARHSRATPVDLRGFPMFYRHRETIEATFSGSRLDISILCKKIPECDPK